MKLYLKQTTEFKSVDDVIQRLYFKDDGTPLGEARPTYCDEACTVRECGTAYRSFEDILCVVRTYFPSTTEKKLMQVMLEHDISIQYCSDIRKITFYSNSGDSYWKIKPERLNDEIGKFYVQGTYTPQKLVTIYNRAVK